MAHPLVPQTPEEPILTFASAFFSPEAWPKPKPIAQHGSDTFQLRLGLPGLFLSSSPRLALLRRNHREAFGGEGGHTCSAVCITLQEVLALLEITGEHAVLGTSNVCSDCSQPCHLENEEVGACSHS